MAGKCGREEQGRRHRVCHTVTHLNIPHDGAHAVRPSALSEAAAPRVRFRCDDKLMGASLSDECDRPLLLVSKSACLAQQSHRISVTGTGNAQTLRRKTLCTRVSSVSADPLTANCLMKINFATPPRCSLIKKINCN